MKIAICSPMFSPEENGLVSSVLERTYSLLKLGHEVTLIIPILNDKTALKVVKDLSDNGVKIIKYDAYEDKKNNVIRPLRKSVNNVIPKLLRNNSYDIVFVDSPLVFYIMCGFLPKLKHLKNKNTKLIGICHADVSLGMQINGLSLLSFLVKRFGHLIYNKYSKTVVPSSFLQKKLKKVNNTISVNFLGSNDTESKARESIPDNFMILYVGRLDKEKNIDFLYSIAQKSITQSSINIKWVFAGGGTDYEYWKNKSSEKISFLGPIPHDEITELYINASAFITACYHETFGLTIVEAMAANLPAIVPDSDMARKHIPNECKSLIYKPDDADNILEIITRLSTDENYYIQMSNHKSLLHINWDIGTENLLSKTLN